MVEYERRMKIVQREHDSAEMDKIALDAAGKIEDIFARGSTGGVAQRKAAIQVLIRALLEDTLRGV